MKKNYLICAILFSIGGICFLLAGIINNAAPLPGGAPSYVYYFVKYGYYFAAVCMLIAGAGYLYSYYKDS